VRYDRSGKFDKRGWGVYKWKHYILIPESITDSILWTIQSYKIYCECCVLAEKLSYNINLDLQNGEQEALSGCHVLPDRSSHF